MALLVITGPTVALSVSADTFAAAIIGVLSGIEGGIICDFPGQQNPRRPRAHTSLAPAALDFGATADG